MSLNLKKFGAVILGLIAVSLPACSNDVDPGTAVNQPAAADMQDELEGTWELIYFERDGKAVKIKPGGTHSVFTGDKFVVKRGEEVVSAGTSTFEPTAKPMTAVSTYTEGRDKGKTFKSICQLEGDEIKFCRAGSPDDDFPIEFKTTPGSGTFISVYRRVSR